MKNYRIMLDITSVYIKIKHLILRSYNSPFPTIFISAKDPDEACRLVFDELITLLIHQDPSIKMRIICRQIKRYCRIDKIYSL
jgi:hypothetical protein